MTRILLVLSLAAGPAAAQTNALILFVDGGRSAPLVDLSSSGDDFAGAFTLGGGVGLQLGPTTAVRGSFRRADSEYRGSALSLADSGVGRTYLGIDLQTGWPGTSGFVPYVFVGGGAVRTVPDDPGQLATTTAGGRLGAGFNWLSGPLALFAEADAWVYRFNGMGFEQIQVDVLMRAGLAVPFVF